MAAVYEIQRCVEKEKKKANGMYHKVPKFWDTR